MKFSWNNKILIVVLYIFALKYVHSDDTSEERDYVLKLKGWEKMEENNPYIDYKSLKMKKVDRTHYVMDGTFEILRDDISKDDLLMSVLGAVKKSNGFQQSSLVQLEKKNYCEFVSSEKMIMEDLIKATNITQGTACPLPKGVYSIKEFLPSPDKFPKSVPKEYWRLSFIQQIGDTILSGVHVYVDVQPKPPGQ